MAAPYLGIYGEINNGAHRKAAELIGAPALIWHQALWNPECDPEKREKRIRNIQTYHEMLEARIDKEAEPINRSHVKFEIGPTDRSRVYTQTFIWQGLRTRVRVEAHTEYVTITSIIDLSVDISKRAELDKAALRAKYHVYRHLETKMGELHEALDFREWKAREMLSPDSGERHAFADRMRELAKDLYEKFWEEIFDKKILDTNQYLAKGNLGSRFADFRGIITCEQYPQDPKPPKEDLEHSRIFENPLQEPFYRDDEARRGQWQRIAAPGDLWARARLNAAWPFLMAMQEHLPMRNRKEFTASCFNKGRILHVSALGPQPTDRTQGGELPIFYYVHSATQCERQIGRLVDRMCQLGTLRLASVIALPALKSVGQSLREVENRMSKARADIQELISRSNPATSTTEQRAAARQELSARILDEFYEIQKKMASISAGEDDNNRDLGNESLDFRLARSTYYRTQYNSIIESLRIKRIEGYQPYNMFVRRRLESAFAFMDSVERRLREIQRDWRALDQLYLTTNMTILTGEIDDEQKSAKLIQQQIKDLQVGGEKALLWVLLPYYASSLIFADFVGCGSLINCSRYEFLRLDIEQWGTIAITLLFWGVYVYNIWKAKRERKRNDPSSLKVHN